MRVWRIVRREFAPGLDGEGAKRYGGRWNSPGMAAIYSAGSLSLAALEYFVHVPPSMRTAAKIPPLRAIGIDLPAGAPVTTLTAADVPVSGDVRDFRAIGDAFLADGTALALQVPSLVIPLESNFILNPYHPLMPQAQVAADLDFVYDPRLTP